MTREAVHPAPRVISFEPRLAADFQRLNLEWIEPLFGVEEPDRRQLGDPQGIVQAGGEVFFALVGEEVLGTCALLFTAPGHYHLAKMAVTTRAQGQGLGRLLLDAALRWARQRGATAVDLISHSSLTPALHLYQQAGFRRVPVPSDTGYERCDVAMRLELD